MVPNYKEMVQRHVLIMDSSLVAGIARGQMSKRTRRCWKRRSRAAGGRTLHLSKNLQPKESEPSLTKMSYPVLSGKLHKQPTHQRIFSVSARVSAPSLHSHRRNAVRKGELNSEKTKMGFLRSDSPYVYELLSTFPEHAPSKTSALAYKI